LRCRLRSGHRGREQLLPHVAAPPRRRPTQLRQRRARAGAASGVADEAYFGRVRAYVARQGGPAPVAASIDFVHGLAAWDFAEAVRASKVLLPLAERGEHWISPHLLREGTVASHLRLGDAAGARAALTQLRGAPARGRGDVRQELLAASVAAAEAAPRPPVARR
jgi:hypothetical protein